MIQFNHELLRDIRKSKRLKQTDVAKKLHCTGATISRWELGDTQITVKDFARLLTLYSIENANQFFSRSIKTRNMEVNTHDKSYTEI